MKQQISPVIDMSTYLELKTRGVNISKLVNDLLKSYVASDVATEKTAISKNLENERKKYAEALCKIKINEDALAKIEQQEKEAKAKEIIWIDSDDLPRGRA